MRDIRLPEFPCVVPVEVRFRDVDATGYVNTAVYFTYFEQARLALWEALRAGAPHASPGATAHGDLAVVRAECDFASPARRGERLLVGCRFVELGNSSFVLEYRAVAAGSSGDDEVRPVASGRTVQVCWDRAAGKKTPIPEEVRRRADSLQPGVPRSPARPGHAPRGS